MTHDRQYILDTIDARAKQGIVPIVTKTPDGKTIWYWRREKDCVECGDMLFLGRLITKWRERNT